MTSPPFSSEDQRYQYSLSSESVVVDFGGYNGDWAARMVSTYGCRVFCFEPIAKNAERILGRGIPRLTLFQCAVGAWSRNVSFGVANDSTGAYSDSGDKDVVWCVSFRELLEILPRSIDVLKINVEGMEYEILGDSADLGGIKNIQVQFHGNVPEAEEKRDRIRKKLAENYDCTYCTPFVWENWKRR